MKADDQIQNSLKIIFEQQSKEINSILKSHYVKYDDKSLCYRTVQRPASWYN